MSTLDEALETPKEEIKEAPKEETPKETPEETPKDPETKGEETAPPADVDTGLVPRAALLDERRKRQDLERQVKENTERVSVLDDEEAAFSQSESRIMGAMENKLLNISEANVRRSYKDADVMIDKFINELALNNPALQQQALSEPDPYEFIYKTAKNHVNLQELGDPESWKQAERDKIRAEILAEQTEQKIQDSIPTTLSTATAAGGSSGKTYTGQTPLDNIFPK